MGTNGKLIVLLFVLSFAHFLPAQQDSISRDFFCGTDLVHPAKGKFYFAWGYNKNWYSTTDVHVHDASGDFDFTLYNMKAHDHTHFNELFSVALSIPQYGYRLGYWMPNEKYGVEIKFDHAKYIVYDDQRVHLKGSIGDNYYDVDTVVDDHFMHLEHTDGANYLMLNGMYRYTLASTRYVQVAAVGKFG